MKRIKLFGLGLFFALGALLVSFIPTKASAQIYGDSFRGYNRGDMISRYRYPVNYNQYMNRYPNYYGNIYDNYYSRVTYPRTVYLIDAGNSANQLNIINATRGGSTTAAYITVSTYDYNRLVNDYNTLGVMSIRVNAGSNLVTFQTVNGTYTVDPILVSFQ